MLYTYFTSLHIIENNSHTIMYCITKEPWLLNTYQSSLTDVSSGIWAGTSHSRCRRGSNWLSSLRLWYCSGARRPFSQRACPRIPPSLRWNWVSCFLRSVAGVFEREGLQRQRDTSLHCSVLNRSLLLPCTRSAKECPILPSGCK